jgi:hypothetical protein
MLCERAPSLRSPAMGVTMLALLSLGAGAAAWAAQPPVVDAAPAEICEDAGDYYVVASAEGGYATVAAQDVSWMSPTFVVTVDRQAGLEARKQDRANAMQLVETGKPERFVVKD